MDWKRISILAWFDLHHSIFKLKGLVYLIPFCFFWYWILEFLLKNGGKLLSSSESILILSWLYKPAIAQILLILHPPTLSMFFIISLATIPFFAMLSGNDQLASDTGRQTFRYLITRCTRSEIFFSRLISHYLMLAITAICVAIVATVISLHVDQRNNTETIEYALQVTILILIYMIPFVGFMSAVSAFMSSGLGALLMSITLYTVLLMAGSYLGFKFGTDFSLVPSGFKEYLFDINDDDLQTGLVGLLAYACVYTTLGWLIFRKRNI
jgi:hypothetical protein